MREFKRIWTVFQRRGIWNVLIILFKFSPRKMMRKLQKFLADCFLWFKLQYLCISTLQSFLGFSFFWLPVHLFSYQVFIIFCHFLASWLFLTNFLLLQGAQNMYMQVLSKKGGKFARNMIIALHNVCIYAFTLKTWCQLLKFRQSVE